MLKVKRLDKNAVLPTVAHPGEDLAYDVYSLEDKNVYPNVLVKIRTGIAVSALINGKPAGLLVRDRSSMASKGITVSGGVIDAGYRGELSILLTGINGLQIYAGDKIAQMIPFPVNTGEVVEVQDLDESNRGDKGFGSSGY